ncbi:DNA-binding IclR family transcriptional regulator [Streptomyces sp. SAI-124]
MSQTVDRALSILPLLAEGPADLGQVADRLGVHKSTALRLLRTLHEHGMVYRQSDQRYRLGARLIALAQEAMENLDIREIAHPHLVRLNEQCGHTVHLAVYEEDEVLYIDKVESRYPVRMYSRIGKPVAITVAAVAKLLLADLPEAERHALADKLDYPLYTARSTPNAACLPQGAGARARTGLGHRPRWPRGVHQLRRGPRPRRRRQGRRRDVGLRAERRRHRRGTPHPPPAGPPYGRRHQRRVLRQNNS